MRNDENNRDNNDKKGLVSRVYDAVDNTIMYGVNKMTKGYNWTTGGTKTELANGLLVDAAVAFPTGIFLFNPVLGRVITLVILPSIHYKQKRNVEIEKKESKALEKGLLDLEVEIYKKRNRENAELNLMLSGINEGIGLSLHSNESNILVGIGCGLSALDGYVMRADNLPPRKNCLSRGMDNLKEIVSSYSPKPVVAPAGGI